MTPFKHQLGPFLSGVLFSVGLGISGMTESSKILGFLDIFGDWQPHLIFVMGAALMTYGFLFRFITRSSRPLTEAQFFIPKSKKIDQNLVGGSLIFGVGWGVTGLCPGPGLVGLVTLESTALFFCLAMIGGMLVGKRLDLRESRVESPRR